MLVHTAQGALKLYNHLGVRAVITRVSSSNTDPRVAYTLEGTRTQRGLHSLPHPSTDPTVFSQAEGRGIGKPLQHIGPVGRAHLGVALHPATSRPSRSCVSFRRLCTSYSVQLVSSIWSSELTK